MQGPGNAAERWNQGPKAASLRFATAIFFCRFLDRDPEHRPSLKMMRGWGLRTVQSETHIFDSLHRHYVNIRQGF